MSIDLKLDENVFETYKADRPIMIAGPCSAESEEQIVETAKKLSYQGVKIFRAGIWKPRTRPGSFEGIGAAALPWLKRAKEETGMLVSCEVANAMQAFQALKFGVDILWIGARTSANPFAVQEIADSIKGVDIPVMVKNPVNPDLELWIGALERLNQAGITKLAGIHRGFSSYGATKYRNEPQWQLPIEIKRRIPGLTMICDPSHIGGDTKYIQEISQKALDLNFDGLMIETHPNPTKALSDAKQQLTPDELFKLRGELVLRSVEDLNSSEIEVYRGQIDNFDDLLVETFINRMNVVKKIGEYKKENNLAILQSGRWNEIIEKRMTEGVGKGLSKEFVNKIFGGIHQESINIQTTILNKGKKATK